MAWIYQRPESENWWLGYRLNGHQYRRSIKTTDRKQAERELEKLNSIAHAHKAGSLTDEFVTLLTRKRWMLGGVFSATGIGLVFGVIGYLHL